MFKWGVSTSNGWLGHDENLPRDWSDSASCQSLSRAAEATCKLRWFQLVRDTAQDGSGIIWRWWNEEQVSEFLWIKAGDRRLERKRQRERENITSRWEKIQQVALSCAKLSMVANSLQSISKVCFTVENQQRAWTIWALCHRIECKWTQLQWCTALHDNHGTGAIISRQPKKDVVALWSADVQHSIWLIMADDLLHEKQRNACKTANPL